MQGGVHSLQVVKEIWYSMSMMKNLISEFHGQMAPILVLNVLNIYLYNKLRKNLHAPKEK